MRGREEVLDETRPRGIGEQIAGPERAPPPGRHASLLAAARQRPVGARRRIADGMRAGMPAAPGGAGATPTSSAERSGGRHFFERWQQPTGPRGFDLIGEPFGIRTGHAAALGRDSIGAPAIVGIRRARHFVNQPLIEQPRQRAVHRARAERQAARPGGPRRPAGSRSHGDRRRRARGESRTRSGVSGRSDSLGRNGMSSSCTYSSMLSMRAQEACNVSARANVCTRPEVHCHCLVPVILSLLRATDFSGYSVTLT